MSSIDEFPESNRSRATSSLETDGMWKEERLAALLLRLLGVYFISCAIISGALQTSQIVHLFYSDDRILKDLLPKSWTYVASIAVEFSLGFYFLIGGQWVFERLLAPVVRRPSGNDGNDTEVKGNDGAG